MKEKILPSFICGPIKREGSDGPQMMARRSSFHLMVSQHPRLTSPCQSISGHTTKRKK